MVKASRRFYAKRPGAGAVSTRNPAAKGDIEDGNGYVCVYACAPVRVLVFHARTSPWRVQSAPPLAIFHNSIETS